MLALYLSSASLVQIQSSRLEEAIPPLVTNGYPLSRRNSNKKKKVSAPYLKKIRNFKCRYLLMPDKSCYSSIIATVLPNK